MNKRFFIVSILILTAVNILTYGKTIGYEFVRLDDPVYVSDNPYVNDFNADKVKDIFTKYYNYNYQPLVILSYALEYKLFKNNPAGYHVTNVILHMINAILVLYLIYLLCGSGYAALIVALFFSLHPMQVESVAWVSERKGLMCTLFYLLSFMSYIKYKSDAKRKLYLSSILLFLAALLSKPMAVTFPVILILYDYLKEKLSKESLIKTIPFFALSFIFAAVTLLAQKSGGAVHTTRMKFTSDLFFFVFYNISFYAGKLFLPVKLSAHYGYPESVGLLSKEIGLSLLAVIALILYVRNFKRIKREINFGIVFFLISLLPVLRFVPIGNTLAADRYVYMPIIGFFFALVTAFYPLGQKSAAAKNTLVAALTACLFLFGVMTHLQLGTWENSYELYNNMLKTSPGYGRAYMGLGYYYTEKNDNKKARESYAKALNDKYERERALFYMGVSYVYDKDPYKATEYFSTLVNEFPENEKRNNTYAYRFLGDASAFFNKDEEAIGYYLKSLELDPNNFQAHYGYGAVLEKRGDVADAIRHYKISNRINDKWNMPIEALKRLKAIE